MLNYRGSKRHKRWVPGGASGSICPNWTHDVAGRNFGSIPPELWEEWPKTTAQALLTSSIPFKEQRYAAANGLAFCAQSSSDGTWHGYPIPWKDVPEGAKDQMIAAGLVDWRTIRRGLSAQSAVNAKLNLNWASD